MSKRFTKVLAMILALIMSIGILPFTAFAAAVKYETGTDDYYKVISKKDYELAPGIVESEIVLNNDSGTHRQVAHVVEVDLNNPYTKVIPSSKGMIPTPGNYGVQIMSEQAKYAEEHGYGNVVAAMNLSLSWYNDDYYKAHPELVGEPLGYLILDGKMYVNSRGQTSGAQTCVVINFDEKDGVARPESMPKVEIRSTSTAVTGWEEQVIPANFGFLVKDGKNLYSIIDHTSDRASRSFVGIKEDGTLVMVMNDGRQSPYSAGFNSYEMAEFMLSLGCVAAVNGDGGGSSAFLSQRPGEELKINCSPSDGAERETTHGILVISTAPATGEFVRASLSTENDYYTPNSSVQISAIGSDLVGTAADIPAEATYELKDGSFGSIDNNGLFVSNGKQGTVIVQMVYNGEIVGEKEIHIGMPDSFVFDQKNMVVPYGKTVSLPVTAKYGAREVTLKVGDVQFTLSEQAIGTVSGYTFTAAEEGCAVTKATLTAVIGACTAEANISLGRGSKIVYDFEDQNIDGWTSYSGYLQYGPKGPNGNILKDPSKSPTVDNYWYNGQNELGSLEIVDSESGKVRHGDYALAMNLDFSQIYETGYHRRVIKFPGVSLKDAVSVGFWIYVPEEAFAAELELAFDTFQTVYDNGKLMPIDEDGWRYVTVDVSAITEQEWDGFGIQVDDRAGNNYDYVTQPNLNGKYTFYIDDITIDYSTAVDDRENPVFSNPVVIENDDATSALNGQTIGYNVVSFEVSVADAEKENATGIDEGTAKAYIDGVEVPSTYRNGKIQISGITLADGVHTIKFAICDKAGNCGSVVRKINIQANSELPTIKVVPHDTALDRIKIGSLYYIDIIATDIEKVKTVEVDLDLINTSTWELEHMIVAEGFAAAYEMIDAAENIARITLTRISDSVETGEVVIASLPAHTWESHITEYEGYENQTPEVLWSRGIIWAKSLTVHTDRGVVTFVDNSTSTFCAADIDVMTEIFFTNYSRNDNPGATEYKASHTSWHIHSAHAIPDVAATCTKSGYVGRTFCDECNSVVDWGITVPATGHTYKTVGTQLICDCGEVFSADGFVEVGGKTMYFIGSNFTIGVLKLGSLTYYFDNNGCGYQGEYTLCGETCLFTEGKFVSCSTASLLDAGWCGEEAEYVVYADGLLKLDGSGSTHNYINHGTRPFIGVSNRITKIEVGKDITVLGQNIFAYLIAKEVVFEEGSKLNNIRTGAFLSMPYLKNIDIPVNVTRISAIAFKNCAALRRINLPVMVGSINSTTFIGCSADLVLCVTKDSYSESYAISEGLKYTNDGFIRNGVYAEDGGLFYYVNDIRTNAGLVKIGEDYYYTSAGGAVKTGKYWVTRNNGLLPSGYYFFDEETGKMQIKNGVYAEDGGLFYYVNDVRTNAGLVKVGEDYYYISAGGAVKTGKYWVTRNNGLLPSGYYFFDEETGKMRIKNGVYAEDGGLFYYVNDVRTNAGLVKVGEDYYYASAGGAVKTGKYWVTRNNGLLSSGYYFFDEETGKMIR